MAKNCFLIVCIVCVVSCSKEDNRNSALSIKAEFPQVATRSSNTEEDIKLDTLLWCPGYNIKWFNATTGELKLNNTPSIPELSGSIYLVVFLDDKKLLTFKTANNYSSATSDYPCIIMEPGEGYWRCKTHLKDHIPVPSCEMEYIMIKERSYYISKGYPPRWTGFAGEECEKNWKAIEPEYNLFIEQLKKEGKYRE